MSSSTVLQQLKNRVRVGWAAEFPRFADSTHRSRGYGRKSLRTRLRGPPIDLLRREAEFLAHCDPHPASQPSISFGAPRRRVRKVR